MASFKEFHGTAFKEQQSITLIFGNEHYQKQTKIGM